MEVNYNDGLIHGWNGGELPVHVDSTVKVYLRRWCAGDLSSVDRAYTFRWEHIGSDDDIIAFQVIKERREPRDIWINFYLANEPYIHYLKENADRFAGPDRTECVHYREVIE